MPIAVAESSCFPAVRHRDVVGKDVRRSPRPPLAEPVKARITPREDAHEQRSRKTDDVQVVAIDTRDMARAKA